MIDKNTVIKIALVGPESTGKSTMARSLAIHYQTLWVPEFARYYCTALTKACTLDDETTMYHGQVALEESVISVLQKPLLFCDTTFLTVKIWSDYQLGETPQIVLDALPKHNYDLYLLLKPDLPWQDDPLRDFKGMGDYFMNVWRNELKNLGANYIETGGTKNRFENAVKIIDAFLSKEI